MPTVTYKHQPGIHATRGAVPIAGTSHLYRVKKILWPETVQEFLAEQFIPPTLHICAGFSLLGDVRVDMDAVVSPTVIADAAALPFRDGAFATVLCDPPYNGKMQWNHDLLTELSRVAKLRIIFQHWFLPTDKLGRWKKRHAFVCSGVFIWQPKTYFGRVQVITIADNARYLQVGDSVEFNTKVDEMLANASPHR